MLHRRRARKLIDRAQPFAAEPLLVVANFTWVQGRADWARGLPEWTLIGAGSTRLWVVEANRRHPDTGASLVGSWPLADVRLVEEHHPRRAGPIALGSWRAIRFELPEREPAVLEPFGKEVDLLIESWEVAQSGVRWEALAQVALINSSEGPVEEDVFFALTYDDETTTFVGLGEAEALLPRLQALPGFDNETFIEAMVTTEESASVLWRR